jgi:biotin transporter BioY
VLYALGLPWFQAVLAAKFTTLWAAFLFMSPYLIGDLVKVAAAVILSRSLLPLLK